MRQISIYPLKHALALVIFIYTGLITACSATPGTTPESTPPLSATSSPSPNPPQINVTSTSSGLAEQKILYTDTNRDLWIWDEILGSRQITTSSDIQNAIFSPSGDQIIFTRQQDQSYSLWSITPAGTNEREWITAQQFNGMPSRNIKPAFAQIMPLDFQWVNQTPLLIFTTAYISPANEPIYNYDLWKLDTSTGQLQAAIQAGSGGRPVLSKDGSRAALVRPDSISTIKMDGSSYLSNVLTFQTINTYTKREYFPLVQWSPDNQSFICIIPPANGYLLPLQPTTIWRVPVDETQQPINLAQITTSPLHWPQLSPDSTWIAYQSPIDENPDLPLTSLHLFEINSGLDQVYYTDQMNFLGWAPDSRHFLMSVGQGSMVTTIGMKDTLPVSLPGYGIDGPVHWPGTTNFTFLSQRESAWELHLADINLSNRILTIIPALDQTSPEVLDVLP